MSLGRGVGVSPIYMSFSTSSWNPTVGQTIIYASNVENMSNKLLSAVAWVLLAAFTYAGTTTPTPPPTRFTRHGEVWQIYWDTRGLTLNGTERTAVTLFSTRMVSVRGGLGCEEKQRVLLHEWMHIAAWHGTDGTFHTLDGWLEDGDEDHQPMDVGLVGLARENPGVWEWISVGCK